jgi:hypothetical protein
MNKLKYFIFMSICEVSLELFKDSMYSTYINYCKGMSMSIDNGNLSKKEKHDIIKITNYLDLLYGFGEDEIAAYIVSYFESDRVAEFQKIVSLNETIYRGFDDVKTWIKKDN